MASWTEPSEIYASRLVPLNALVLTGLATFRLVGQPEVILGPDLFGRQVVNALLYCVGLSETDRLLPELLNI